MDQFVGQIECFAFGFAPANWAICAGQLLPIAQNQALFALLGTTYGGDGIHNFALPDLRGRVAVGPVPFQLGQQGGEEMHTLTLAEMPGSHGHAVNAMVNGTAGGTNAPGPGVYPASGYAAETGSPPVNIYGPAGAPVAMGSLTPTGGTPHENRMPFLAMTYCIALTGIFPSRN